METEQLKIGQRIDVYKTITDGDYGKDTMPVGVLRASIDEPDKEDDEFNFGFTV